MIEEKITETALVESRTAQLDDLLDEKLERAFHQETSHIMLQDVAQIASEHDPIDLAHVAMRLPSYARVVLYDNLPDSQAKITFLINTSSNTRVAIFKHLAENEIVTLIEKMPPDEAVWILDDMSSRQYKRVLEAVNEEIANRIRKLQTHDRESAGRLMTDEFFAFHLTTTLTEVAAKIRANPGIALTGQIFVLNDYDELCGLVPERSILINKGETTVRQIMQPILHQVTTTTSRDEVVDLMERYELPALPVVDEYQQLVGVIPFEAGVEAIKDILDDTIASIAGTAEDFDEDDPLLKRFFWRAPWLIVTIFGGFITATSLTLFRGNPWFIIVPFFVPLIAGFSGNVGIQCSTLLVRSIASGDLSTRTKRQTVFREVLIGAFIGLIFGIFCGFLIYLLNHLGIYSVPENSKPFAVAITVSIGLFGACFASTMLGSFSPFLFVRMGVDPAVASGPIVTALNDVMSSWIFILAAWGLSYLFFA